MRQLLGVASKRLSLFADPDIYHADSLTQFILHRAVGDAPAGPFSVILITARFARAAA